MRILPRFDEETIRTTLEHDLPDLEIGTLKLIDHGWDNMVADVNGAYIFRFPRDEGVQLEWEIRMLRWLQGKLSLPIPRIEWVGASYDYMGYRKIPGISLTADTYHSLSECEKDCLAHDLALFLHEMHSSATAGQAREMGVGDYPPQRYVDGIRKHLAGISVDDGVISFVGRAVVEYEEEMGGETELALLYSDLHGDNLAFDPVAKRVNGVFDFGDLSIGSIYSDFGPPYSFSADLAERMAGWYGRIGGREIDLRKVQLSGYICEIYDAIECGDARLKAWVGEGRTAP